MKPLPASREGQNQEQIQVSRRTTRSLAPQLSPSQQTMRSHPESSQRAHGTRASPPERRTRDPIKKYRFPSRSILSTSSDFSADGSVNHFCISNPGRIYLPQLVATSSKTSMSGLPPISGKERILIFSGRRAEKSKIFISRFRVYSPNLVESTNRAREVKSAEPGAISIPRTLAIRISSVPYHKVRNSWTKMSISAF